MSVLSNIVSGKPARWGRIAKRVAVCLAGAALFLGIAYQQIIRLGIALVELDERMYTDPNLSGTEAHEDNVVLCGRFFIIYLAAFLILTLVYFLLKYKFKQTKAAGLCLIIPAVFAVSYSIILALTLSAASIDSGSMVLSTLVSVLLLILMQGILYLDNIFFRSAAPNHTAYADKQ